MGNNPQHDDKKHQDQKSNPNQTHRPDQRLGQGEKSPPQNNPDGQHRKPGQGDDQQRTTEKR